MEGSNNLPAYSFDSLMENDVSMTNANANAVATQLKDLKRLVYLGLTWMAGLSIYLYVQHGDIQAVKQSIKDHGLGDIVSELKSPKSPEQLRANLSTVIADIQTARVKGNSADKDKVAALSGALSQVIQGSPLIPESWQAASELVSYKSRPVSDQKATTLVYDSLPVCTDSTPIASTDQSNIPGIILPQGYQYAYYENCRFTLDSIDETKRLNSLLKDKFPIIQFRNSLIIYGGGDISVPTYHTFMNVPTHAQPPSQGTGLTLNITMPSLLFQQCKFDFSVPKPIIPKAQQLMQALLEEPGPLLSSQKIGHPSVDSN